MNNYQLGIRAIHQKNIKTAIIEAAKNGFQILEIHLSSPQFLPQIYSANQIKAIRAFAKKSNIGLQIHSEINSSLIEADDVIRAAEKKRLERVVKFSRALGARSLTLHPGKAPSYYLGNAGKVLQNDGVYSNFYHKLFEIQFVYIFRYMISKRKSPIFKKISFFFNALTESHSFALYSGDSFIFNW